MIDPVSIKERVVVARAARAEHERYQVPEPLFTPEERDFILHAINTYHDIKTAEREYPSRHKPDSPGATMEMKAAWAILDNNVPNNMISRTARFYIAGLIAGALSELKIGREP